MAIDEDRQSHHPLWVRAAVSEDAFAHEQACFGKYWSFVGFVTDLPNVGDWVRTMLGGKSIFIQRFDDGIKAFENRCAHRFYPLRTEPKGNGPIVCGAHHWRYNSDGVAVGIPHCQDMFGKLPRDMGARIATLDVDTCGDLIFARFPSDNGAESLRAYLSDGFEILQATCKPRRKPYRFNQHVKAYWKFSHHISLDDYHIVAVHPASFGRNGYLKNENIQYHRFGRHSAYISTPNVNAFADTLNGCINGTYAPDSYSIYNFFPNFLLSQFRVPDAFGTTHWYALVMRYLGLSAASTEVQAWLFEVPFAIPEKTLTKWNRGIIDFVSPPIVAYYAKKILAEDNAVCEGQQAAAAAISGEQILSAQERRIGWFEEAYAAALTA